MSACSHEDERSSFFPVENGTYEIISIAGSIPVTGTMLNLKNDKNED